MEQDSAAAKPVEKTTDSNEAGDTAATKTGFPEGDPSTATVQAAYRQWKREDTQMLHIEVVLLLETWLATKPELAANDLLFPVSGKVPGGVERKTAIMMQLDMETARRSWIEEAETDDERIEREQLDYLASYDEAGRFADAGGKDEVRPAGFEPATFGLGNRCSILLSYGRFILQYKHFCDSVIWVDFFSTPASTPVRIMAEE